MAIADLAYQQALDRWAADGLAGLSELELDLATLWHVEADVTNGGFLHYYSRPGADLAFHAPEALARMGAAEKSAILTAANAVFGPSGPPRDREKRRAALQALAAGARSRFDELENRYYQDPVDVDELVEQAVNRGSTA
jgi:hypothetical protein